MIFILDSILSCCFWLNGFHFLQDDLGVTLQPIVAATLLNLCGPLEFYAPTRMLLESGSVNDFRIYHNNSTTLVI